jgi:hypothetical protein
VGFRRSGRCGDETFLDPTETPNSDFMVVQPVASRKTDHAISLTESSKYYMKILLDFNTEVGRKDFSNQQLGMKVYTKLIMIMELE